MSFFGRLSPPTRDLMRLLLVLGSAIAFAFALSYYFIHYHSPTGSLKVEAVVLLGDTLEDLNYIDEGTAGTSARYLFDKITFHSGRETPITIPVNRYQELLLALHGDRSLTPSLGNKKASLFQGPEVAHLLVYVVSSAGGVHAQRKIFQEIQIVKDDYRVNLHDEKIKEQWAYFHHLGVQTEAMKLLVEVKP